MILGLARNPTLSSPHIIFPVFDSRLPGWKLWGEVSHFFKVGPGRCGRRALHPEYLEEPNQQVWHNYTCIQHTCLTCTEHHRTLVSDK